MKCNLPMVHQYSVFDEVENVVKVGQVPDVDNLPPEGKKKEKRSSTYCQKSAFSELVKTEETGSYYKGFK